MLKSSANLARTLPVAEYFLETSREGGALISDRSCSMGLTLRKAPRDPRKP